MEHIRIKKYFKRETIEKIIISLASMLLIYFIVSLYFNNHFYFNTIINGVNVSLKSYQDAELLIKGYMEDYKLQLIERNGETEYIIGHEIGMQYNDRTSISNIYHLQNPLKWISSFIKGKKYYLVDLYVFDIEKFNHKIDQLNCLNKAIIEPRNVDFKYSKGSYQVIEEVYGNKIKKDKLYEIIKINILKGETKIDLNEKLCYENPKYIMKSKKTLEITNSLNKYVSAYITYYFGCENEIIDRRIINKWLSVNEDLEAIINETAIINYIEGLSRKYDTVGASRNFKTSSGKVIEVKGGLYGWKIDKEAETKALMENIKSGEKIEKEPIYSQKALFRDTDDIGKTYIEINITKQKLWFYKDGKLITQGSVVTGNPNRGFATVIGTYMLEYKQKDATLEGPGYEVKVTYWMPFYGNMGLHDASWRSSFGGEIYKRRGTHGCVNAPFYLAKVIFENIEVGTPIICYEEEELN